MKDLNEWTKEIHDNSVEHGWWDEPRAFGEIVALCHSELSEALEAYRNDEPMIWDNNGKPDGMAVEMVDCVIRILDWCGANNINVNDVMETKHKYNCGRSYKHGGKKI